MYAVPAPMVASSLTHCPTELTYHSADGALGLVYFTAESKSAPGKVNVIGLDVETGESHCSCKASEVGRACWHAALVQAAWDGHRARPLAPVIPIRRPSPLTAERAAFLASELYG